MKKKPRIFRVFVALAASALVCGASYGQASSMKLPSLVGTPQIDCAVPAMASICTAMRGQAGLVPSSGLGNRIIKFSDSGTKYVRAKFCTGVFDDDTVRDPIESFADGTFLWRFSIYQTRSFLCYFNGEAGVINGGSLFENTTNFRDTSTRVLLAAGPINLSYDSGYGVYSQTNTYRITSTGYTLNYLTGAKEYIPTTITTQAITTSGQYCDLYDCSGFYF